MTTEFRILLTNDNRRLTIIYIELTADYIIVINGYRR